MFKPSNDRILIKPLAEENKTQGGIIIPDTATEKPTKGTVVAIGDGIDNKKITACKEGDVVLYGKWSGSEIKISGEDYIIVKESDVLGVFK